MWATAVLPHGQLIAVGDGIAIRVGPDGEAVLWERIRNARRLLADPVSADGLLWAVAAQPDGTAFTVGSDGRVLAWVAPGQHSVAANYDRFRFLSSDITAVTALRADRTVLTCGSDGRVLKWTGAGADTSAIELFVLSSPAQAIITLPGERIVTGSRDGAVHVWDPAATETPVELGRHDGPVRTAATLPDDRVVTGGDDGRVLIWNPAEPASAPAEPGGPASTTGPPDPVRAVAVLPDGRVVTGHRGGALLVWNPNAPDAEPFVLGRNGDWLQTLTALADGRIISTGEDGSVQLWDSDLPDSWVFESRMGEIDAMAALPGDRLVTVRPYGNQADMTIWDMRQIKIIAKLRCPAVTSVAAAAAATDEFLIVLANADRGFTVCSSTE